MKRSEAIKLIEKILADNMINDEVCANWILNGLEDAGMLPPTIIKMKAIEANLNGSDGIFSYSQNVNEWESEDE